ncbi:MAG: hypothetical protein KHZ58_17780 [Hungatella hathewayi]|nr:hypothetical protein [Hungatella hathewayi]
MAGQEVQEEYRQERSGGEEPVQKRHGQKKRGHREMGVLILTVLFFAALLAAVYFYLQGKQREPETEGLVYEANIVEGDIPGKTPEERQRELDSIVEEGMLAMSINATPCGKTTGADRSINWLIENPSNQGKLIRVEVWRDDTAEKIYETGAIPPGNYVEAAPLSVELPPGEYRCTARFYAYKEDETYIGQAAAQIQLVLQE